MKTTPAVRALGARPMLIFAGLIAVLAIGSALVAGCGGGGGTQASNQEPAPTETPSTPAETPPATAAVADGAAIYAEKCQLCHGPGGKGDGPGGAALNPKPRDHTDGSYMNARSNDELMTIIKEGKGAMPAWGTSMTDEQVKAVIKHVRTFAVPAYTGPMPS